MEKKNSHLSTLRDRNVHFRFIVGSDRRIFDFSHHQHAIDDAAEHHVFVVQEVPLSTGQEELTTVSVLNIKFNQLINYQQ